jgi:UDP-glucose 4-epimerase
LRAGASDACNGDAFNVGGDVPVSHSDLAAELVRISGKGRVEYVSWPPDKKAIDIGSFYADSTRFMKATGWQPSIPLSEGLRRTIDFYRRHFSQYVDGSPLQETP